MSTDHKCDQCNGSGKESDDDLFGSHKKGDECYSCKGSGFETRYTDALVCPYCGHEDSESWELSESGAKHQCASCEKFFPYETHITREFVSSRADCLNGGEHRWGKPLDFETYLYERCQDCEESKRTNKKVGCELGATSK